MTALDEELVQQVTEVIADEMRRNWDRSGPGDFARAVLASRLVVPAEPVRQIANRYDGKRTNGSAVANRLRAILGDPQHVKERAVTEPRLNEVCACGHGAPLHDQETAGYPCTVEACGCRTWV